MMPRDAGDGLADALVRAARCWGVALAIGAMRSTRWASATFSGERHTLQATAADTPALAGWLAAAPEMELPIRGHLVADLAIDALERRDGEAAIVFAALTVEEV